MNAITPCSAQSFFKTIAEDANMGVKMGLYLGFAASLYSIYNQGHRIVTPPLNHSTEWYELVMEIASHTVDKTMAAALVGGGLGLLVGTAHAIANVAICIFSSINQS